MRTLSGLLLAPFLIFSVTVLLLPLQLHAFTQTVSLPISIDYPLLRSLIVKTAYTDPGQTAVLLNENDGCRKVTISEPSVKAKNALILFETKLHILAGTSLLNYCVVPIEWEGYLELVQKPIIDKKWNLSFQTVDSTLYDINHQSTKMTGVAWELAKEHVYDYFKGISINLAPPVLEFETVLVELFPAELKANVKTMIERMAPGKIDPAAAALQIGIVTEVPEALKVATGIKREKISTGELEAFIDTWEAWDSFLVLMITSLSKEPLSQIERQTLLDALLETRHQFVTGLLSDDMEKDFVRAQFISTWKKLSPIFRKQLGDDPSKSLFGYLAFLTASDALSALDKISPAMGIEISRNGLIRLARLLAEDKSLTLDYNIGVDSKLRQVLGLGVSPKVSSRVTPMEELEIGKDKIELFEDNDSNLEKLMMLFLCRSAWANPDETTTTFEDILPWVFSRKNVETYVVRVKALLEETSDSKLKDSEIENGYHDLYRLIVLSTAWQESCFRQFRIRNKKVTYLLSYNRTSVGLMQVNELVWRGMYDRQNLRWNIQYNVAAGCEILDIYMKKYALDRIKKRNLNLNLDNDTLARIVYAMYNGGPGQFNNFLARNEKGTFYTSGKLFFEKYTWVKNNEWKNIRKCLIGG